jgi:hypothetical protein
MPNRHTLLMAGAVAAVLSLLVALEYRAPGLLALKRAAAAELPPASSAPAATTGTQPPRPPTLPGLGDRVAEIFRSPSAAGRSVDFHQDDDVRTFTFREPTLGDVVVATQIRSVPDARSLSLSRAQVAATDLAPPKSLSQVDQWDRPSTTVVGVYLRSSLFRITGGPLAGNWVLRESSEGFLDGPHVSLTIANEAYIRTQYKRAPRLAPIKAWPPKIARR